MENTSIRGSARRRQGAQRGGVPGGAAILLAALAPWESCKVNQKKKKKGNYAVNLYGKYLPKNLGRRNRRHQDAQEGCPGGKWLCKKGPGGHRGEAATCSWAKEAGGVLGCVTQNIASKRRDLTGSCRSWCLCHWVSLYL